MGKQMTAAVVDDETILLDGIACIGMDELAHGLRSALESDPNFILVIRPAASRGHYKAVITVTYASQRVGVPVENLRLQADNGEIITFDELKARNPMLRV